MFVRRGANGDTHLEHLLPLIDAVLHDAGSTLENCAAFAFGAGPGAFTGLRVACTVVQGMSWAREKPAIPVGSLLALAVAADAGMTDRKPSPRRLFCAIDARMGQAYTAVLEGGGLDWREVEPPSLCDLPELPLRVAQAGVDAVAGDARWLAAQWPSTILAPAEEFAEEFAEKSGAGSGAESGVESKSMPMLLDACGDAEAIARWARHAAASGAGVEPERALPVYVRDRVARTVAERAAERDTARPAAGPVAVRPGVRPAVRPAVRPRPRKTV